MGAAIDLLGCEYLGGCPNFGPRVLNKVALHFDDRGLTVAIAPQGMFTPAEARPAVVLAWEEISVVSLTGAGRGGSASAASRVARVIANVLTMRLDLPCRLGLGTPAWTMTLGVRAEPSDLAARFDALLAGHHRPVPLIVSG